MTGDRRFNATKRWTTDASVAFNFDSNLDSESDNGSTLEPYSGSIV